MQEARAKGIRSWVPVADAVGHCVLVFAFLPALFALPAWLAFELGNPLNARDLVVLGFVFVRGLNTLLDAFVVDAAPGVVAGMLDGLLVSAWVASGGPVSTRPQRMLLGAGCGAVAGTLAILVVDSPALLHGGRLTASGATIAFALASGAVCGIVAAPAAIAFLTARADGPRR